jgi:hypothetical protein
MDNDRFYKNDARNIVAQNQLLNDAYIDFQQQNAPELIRREVILLDEARDESNPYTLSFVFKSVYVSEATDSDTEVKLFLNKANINMDRNSIPLKLKDSMNFTKPVKSPLLTWSAQSGKSIVLYFILNADFYSGSSLTEISSSVEGNSFLNETDVVVTTTPELLLAQNLSRKVANFYNDAAILVASSASSTYWFPWSMGYNIHKNTGALYAKTLAGTANVNILTES